MLSRLGWALWRPVWWVLDRLVPKRHDHWAFATHHIHTTRFVENQRAVFEQVKGRADLRKFVFYRGERPEFELEDAVNTEVVRFGSVRSFLLLARCRVVFVTHSIAMDFSLRWGGGRFSVVTLQLTRRCVVNLWHGIPLKRLLYAANEETRRHTDRVPYRRVERRHYAGLLASSDVDSYAMAAMFYPLHYGQVWRTGLPRNDFLCAPEASLPRYIRDSLSRIRDVRAGRRLVVYAPTYRQASVSSGATYYQFSDAEMAQLRAVLERHDAMLAYRPHYFRNSTAYFNFDRYLDGHTLVDGSQAVIPEWSALARECEVLITDYSSVYLETLYLDKPAISFAYDLEHYTAEQDGLLYDMPLAFAGRVCRTFADVLQELDALLRGEAGVGAPQRAVAQQLFFAHRDAGNAQRVVERTEQAARAPHRRYE